MRFVSVFFLLFYGNAYSQPSEHSAEIMQMKGKWTKHETVNQHGDPTLFSSQYPVLLKKTDTLLNLLKEAYPNPIGLEAFYHASINESPLFERAPAAYRLSSAYHSYYFNYHVNKILLGDETETGVAFFINEFGYSDFLQGQGDWMIDDKPTTVYVPWETQGQWKGFPLYINPYRETNGPIDKAIILTRNGKLPFIPLTQKQYLLALKYRLSKEENNFYTPGEAEKDFQKTLEGIRNNKAFSPETKQKMIDDMQKMHDKQMQSSRQSTNVLTAAYNNKIKVIDDYLSSHSHAEMQQAVVTASLWDFPGYFGPEKNKRSFTPVRVDTSYFNLHLPHYLPQFIVMRWTIGQSVAEARTEIFEGKQITRWVTAVDVAKTEFGKKFESDFPIDKLKQLFYGAAKDADWSNEPVVKGPDMKALRKRAEQYADSIQKKKLISFAPPFSVVIPKDTSSGYKIPSRNGVMLGTIPEKKLSASELKTYLQKIDQKFTSLLLSQGNKLPDVSSLNAMSASYASALYLLQGINNQAAWCAIKAVEKDPEDVVVLNNAGAVLNACGFQPVAVTILQTALDKSPGNSTIQNNIGQSYLAMGDATKASAYLQQCLKISPYHPHANFAMACIEYSKGNNASALNYVEKSLRTSFTDGAMHLFYKLNPDGRLWDILKRNYKATDYFNEDKYHLPLQCENVNDVVRLKAEYKGYREMVEKVKKQFDEIRETENELGEKSLMDQTKNYQGSNLRFSAFTELGAMMVKEIALRLGDEQERLARAQNIYKKEIHDLYEEYNTAYSHAESCAEKLALANKYMEAMAAVTTEYQKTWLPVYREYFDDYAFWGRIQSPDKHLQRAAFAAAASGYLAELLRLAETHFLDLCDPETDSKKEAEDYVIKEPDCGIDVGMNLAIGSFRIDCEKMEYHFGGMLVADVVHTYRTHSTTIAIGAGLDLKFGGEKLKAGPIQGGFGATGKMQYFLTFDGTHPSDQGFIWEGAIEYKQTFNTGLESTIEKIDKVKTNSVDVSAKTVLSVHNGFTSSGSLYEQLDKILEVKPEKPVNKNVKIFNSQK